MSVRGGLVVEQGEYAGGAVGGGDREFVGQVAVDRGAVGSPGGLAGQRGRAEDRPVRFALRDLVLAAAHVGADVAEERAPCHGLEQVAQVGACAFVGDDGAADFKKPAGPGFLHGLDDAAHAVVDDRGGAGAARAYRGDYGVRACYGRGDRGWVHDVGGEDPQPLVGRDCQAGGIADDRCDLMTGRERLLGEACSGSACRAEDGEVHRVRLSWGSDCRCAPARSPGSAGGPGGTCFPLGWAGCWRSRWNKSPTTKATPSAPRWPPAPASPE